MSAKHVNELGHAVAPSSSEPGWGDGHAGHLPRVQGVWPEGKECPRCGDTIIEIGFTVTVVPPLRP